MMVAADAWFCDDACKRKACTTRLAECLRQLAWILVAICSLCTCLARCHPCHPSRCALQTARLTSFAHATIRSSHAHQTCRLLRAAGWCMRFA